MRTVQKSGFAAFVIALAFFSSACGGATTPTAPSPDPTPAPTPAPPPAPPTVAPQVDFATAHCPTTVTVGGTGQCTLTGHYRGGGRPSVDITEFVEEWMSSSPRFASVDQKGVVKGLNPGGPLQINARYSRHTSQSSWWASNQFMVVSP